MAAVLPGETPMMYVARWGDAEVMSLLDPNGGDERSGGDSKFHP